MSKLKEITTTIIIEKENGKVVKETETKVIKEIAYQQYVYPQYIYPLQPVTPVWYGGSIGSCKSNTISASPSGNTIIMSI